MVSKLVVSVHDVAPGSASQTDRWLSALDARGVPLSLLVIPGRWRGRALCDDRAFAAMLAERASGGDEIVQHGWQHAVGADGHGWRVVAQRAVCRGVGEFAAISEQSALLRLRAGRAALAHVGLHAAGFTPPGWLHSPGALRAVKALDYRFTTTHFGVLDLRAGGSIPGIAWSNRPGSATAGLACALLSGGSRLIAATSGLIRIAVHPDDVDHSGLRRATLSAIDRCLDAGARPITYGGLVSARQLARSA